MELIERAGDLFHLQAKFESVAEGEGHCILICGEAGIGKTSLVKTFCREKQKDNKIFQGTCDALFTPRPLAPLYDIALQINVDLWQNSGNIAERTVFFSRLFHELSNQKGTSIVIFEDIHWADEATLDFIKFLARRITLLHCLFILTYRNDEIHARHPLKNVLGQLPHGSFTRLQLAALSKQAVEEMAAEKGYSGEDVYTISAGNPFYVNEILASYSLGVPDNVKDSILSVYNRQDEKTKHVWAILSVMPTGFEAKYLEKAEQSYIAAIENSLESGILIFKEGSVFFKHELYRRTIEASLSPFVRITLNKTILDLFMENFERNHEVERIIHHAKSANEQGIVIKYIPQAAKKAACLGAHIEASNLYFSAIEYYLEKDQDKLVEFYELYAYECHLTNRIKEAIVYQEKSLRIWTEKNDVENICNCMRFLSRLWWFEGNRRKAELYGNKAIQASNKLPPCKAKARAFSNMSQLKMLSDEPAECGYWGEKAIKMAKQLGDEAILIHALTNVGSIQMLGRSSKQKGLELLQQSLQIALENSYHEQVARAYTAIACISVTIKDYKFAAHILEEGIQYCKDRDLESMWPYLTVWKARLLLETGCWNEAKELVESLLQNDCLLSLVKVGALTVAGLLKMRLGEPEALPLLLEANGIAFEMLELQRIIPSMVALLEYEWITGKHFIEQETIDLTINMVEKMGNLYKNSEFAFWLLKARRQTVHLSDTHEGYQCYDATTALKAAGFWEQAGCPYEQALTLFNGNEEDKRKALTIVIGLNAKGTYEKMALEMRALGLKSIPRGIRNITRANVAHLTEREMTVLLLLKEGMQNKEIAASLFISAKTVDNHITATLFKLNVKSRLKAVHEAMRLEII